jgi:hypothetical protein
MATPILELSIIWGIKTSINHMERTNPFQHKKGTGHPPSIVYKNMMTTSGVTGPYQGVKNSRIINQIKNLQKQVRAERRLSHDQIYNSLQLAYHVDGFVHKISVYPDLTVVLRLPDLLQELNKMLIFKSDEPVVISYDTTFNLERFLFVHCSR